jgi:hypothetical protein
VISGEERRREEKVWRGGRIERIWTRPAAAGMLAVAAEPVIAAAAAVEGQLIRTVRDAHRDRGPGTAALRAGDPDVLLAGASDDLFVASA